MTSKPAQYQDEINLRELLSTLWQGRWAILTTTVAFCVVAVAYALLATPIYRSEALVQVRENSGGKQFGGLNPQLGGLAELAGIPLAAGGDRAVSIATLKSRTVFSAFIVENEILPRLYEDDFDESAGKWKSEDPEGQPTLWKAYEEFQRSIFRVTEDKKTELVTVAIEWKNPAEAQQWVTGLIAKTNAYLKAKAAQEAEANLAYLRRQIEHTSVVPLQQALYTLVEAEQKKLMLAEGNAEFALITIDAADKPEKHVKPKRTLVVIIGILLGGILGAAIVLVRAGP